MDISEYNTATSLIALIEDVSRQPNSSWGIVRIKKNHLRPMTDEAFVLAIRALLQEADLANIFFIENKRIFIAWKGQVRSVYKQLRALIGTALARPGLSVDSGVMVAFIDPHAQGESLKNALKVPGDINERLLEEIESMPIPESVYSDDESDPEKAGSKPALTVSSAQIENYQELRSQKPYRKQLHFLVVEDQVFSQKLLCEILRSARMRNNNETPLIDTSQGIHDAWKHYLKKVPDVTFIDLELCDGSGHVLARAIKEIDPTSCVIIVTANNYAEEIGVARQNNVDGFIGKPYNKKQILDCVERYVNGMKTQIKSSGRSFS